MKTTTTVDPGGKTATVRDENGQFLGKISLQTKGKSSAGVVDLPTGASRGFHRDAGGGLSFDEMLETVRSRAVPAVRENDVSPSVKIAVEKKKSELKKGFERFVGVAQFLGVSNPDALKSVYRDAIEYAAFPEGEKVLRTLASSAGSSDAKTIFEAVLATAEQEREKILTEIYGVAETLDAMKVSSISDTATVHNSDIDPETFIHDHATVKEATVRVSEIAGTAAVTGGATVVNSVVEGNATVSYQARVTDSKLSDSSYVGGNVEVVNCNIGGSTIIISDWMVRSFQPSLERDGDICHLLNENFLKRNSSLQSLREKVLEGSKLEPTKTVIQNVKLDKGTILEGAQIFHGGHVKTWVDPQTATLWTCYNTDESWAKEREKKVKHWFKKTFTDELPPLRNILGDELGVSYVATTALADGSYQINNKHSWSVPDEVKQNMAKYGSYGETRNS